MTCFLQAIRTRYQFLPYLYTLFWMSSVSGMPIMRPLWLEFPADEHTFTTDDTFLLGANLLIKPVSSSKQQTTSVYLPGVGPWYELHTGVPSPLGSSTSTGGGRTLSGVATPLSHIPVYQRGGSIIPKKERARRSSALMVNDPYTLLIALDADHTARGELYIDDNTSFDYATKQAFITRNFQFANGKLTATALGGGMSSAIAVPTPAPDSFRPTATIERVVVLGLDTKITAVSMLVAGNPNPISLVFEQSVANPSTFDSAQPIVSRIVVRKPDVPIGADFTITFS